MHNYKVSNLFMAFAMGQETKEVEIKRYIGVAPVTVLAVNPNKEKLDALRGFQSSKDPEYLGTTKIGDKEVKQVRVDFLVRTVPEKSNGIELTTTVSFYIADSAEYTKDGKKLRVINKYGEDTWLTAEALQSGVLPENMQWFNMEGVRAAYRGERDITDFLKAYLIIPNRTYVDRNTGERKTIDDLSMAEAQLGHIEDYFKGDFSEIENILASRPNNRVKLCFGVKTTDDNKIYQDVFIKRTVRNGTTNYSRLDEEIQAAKTAGVYSHTEFSVEPLHEYVVAPTDFSAPAEPTAAPSEGWYN